MRRAAVASAFVLLVAAVAASAYHIRTTELPSFGQLGGGASLGAFHIHSELSHDSSLPLGSLAEAARTDGLDFLVLTDHNEQYAGPVVREGVTIISTAELSTPLGHVVQLAAPAVMSRNGRREPNLLARIRAQGGAPIITHPFDPKRPWTGAVEDASGLEIANIASSTRRLGGPAFVGLLPWLLGLAANPTLAMAQLYTRDDESLALWDTQPDPRFVGLCGSDTHGWTDLAINIKTWVLVLEAPLPQNERERADAIVKAIVGGKFYCSAGMLGRPSRFQFGARRASAWVGTGGDTLPATEVDALEVMAPTVAGATPEIVLFRDGAVAMTESGSELTLSKPGPGTYRVEVRLRLPGLILPGASTPVIYSQRLRLRPPAPEKRDGGTP